MSGMRAEWFVAVAVAVVCSGCGLPATKRAAEQQASKLYDSLAADNFDRALEVYSPQFFTKVDRQKWRQILRGLSDTLGAYKSRRLINWNVRKHLYSGGWRTITTLTYRVKYAKAEATETLVFVGAELPKILAHRISSPALMPGLGPAQAGVQEQGAKPDAAQANAQQPSAGGQQTDQQARRSEASPGSKGNKRKTGESSSGSPRKEKQ